MVPRVLHRERKKKFRELDYEADVLASVNFEALGKPTPNPLEYAVAFGTAGPLLDSSAV